MKDFLKLVDTAGAIVPDGKNGYTVDGKAVTRGKAHQAIARGYTRWNGRAHVLSDAGKAKVAA